MPYEINDLLKKAYADGASDLHISVGSPPVYRLNGSLRPYGEVRLTPGHGNHGENRYAGS